MIEKARAYAIKHHGQQKYGDKPYSYHLDAVVLLLEPYGELAQTIGFLHDIVEDTHITLEDIANEFNPFISQAVDVVTDQPGKNRKQKKQRTYELMSRINGELEIALIVKTADRLANVQASRKFNRDDKYSMYQSEHDQFRLAVYRIGLCDDLWTELDLVLS